MAPIKGYVVRGKHSEGGGDVWLVYEPTGEHLIASRKAQRTEFQSLGSAIQAWADAQVLCDEAAIYQVHPDGREERLPSYEEALGEIERLKDRSRMVRDVDEALHAAGIEARHGEKLGERAARAAMHRCEGPCCNKPAAGVTCSEECAANLSAWLNRGDPLSALEAAERRLLEAGGWTALGKMDRHGRDQWRSKDGLTECRQVALTIERRRLAAKGGA